MLQTRKYRCQAVVPVSTPTYPSAMAIATIQEPSIEKFSVPLDLTEWIDAQTIRAWVKEEIDTLDWSNPELAKVLALHSNLRPRELLTILGYAYAVGIYESEEISRLCTTDRIFRELANGFSCRFSSAPCTRNMA